METLDEFLAHYGVIGMKWGVRRDRKALATASKNRSRGKSTPKKSEDAARAEAAKKKASKGGVKALSNKELQDLNTRLNLEQQYSRLSSTGSGKKAAGTRFAKELLVNVGKTQVTRVANDQVAKALGSRPKNKS